jgi:hypothetical protein
VRKSRNEVNVASIQQAIHSFTNYQSEFGLTKSLKDRKTDRKKERGMETGKNTTTKEKKNQTNNLSSSKNKNKEILNIEIAGVKIEKKK